MFVQTCRDSNGVNINIAFLLPLLSGNDWVCLLGIGCKVAGSLTVFARELSIFTLTVITIERWYTITYAIHLEKRLNLSRAGRIMVFGWLYALIMAACPLLGISGYSKTRSETVYRISHEINSFVCDDNF